MNDGFKDIADILKEVSEDEGMSLREVQDIFRHQKLFVQKNMEDKEVYAIFIPFVGTLSLNIKQAEKEIKGKVRKTYSEFTDKVKNLKKLKGYKEYGNSHKRVTGVNRLARYIKNHYETGEIKPKRIIPHKDCWETIQKYSNNKFKKKDNE